MEDTFWNIIKRLLPFIKPYSKYVYISLFLTVISGAGSQIDPIVLRYLVDRVTEITQNNTSVTQGFTLLLSAGGILLLKGLILLAADLGQGYLGESLKVRVGTDLSNKAYSHMLSLPMAFFEETGNETGKLIRRIDRGAEGLSKVVKNILIDILPLFTTALIGLIVMYSVNVWVGLLSTLIVPVYFGLSYTQAKQQGGIRIKIHDVKESRSQAILNALLSIRIIKSFVREKFEIDKLENLNSYLTTTEINHHRGNKTFDAFKVFSEEIGVALIVILTCYLILNGQMSVGAILLHIMLYRNITAPIRHLHRIYDEHNEAVTFSKGYFELLDTPATELPLLGFYKNNESTLPPKGKFIFEEVSFIYPSSSTYALKDINIEIKHGQTTALVGLSGAGKTTLSSLLVRFHEPKEGNVYLDGKNLREYPIHYLREHIGMVLQENHIFDGSISDNIRYGNTTASDEDVRKAAQLAYIDEYVQKLPSKYDTPAVQLSGGQKQRIALARIFLKNPPILILDEPTASLDAITTEHIKKALDAVCIGRTVLIISHNISQIINANYIYVIKNGEIIEKGNHDSLYKAKGHYAEIIDSNIENMNLRKLLKSTE